MIISQITGGLGNQMFQYAAAKALSLYTGTDLKLDLLGYKRKILPELEVPRAFELPAFENFAFSEATWEEIQKFEGKNVFSRKLQKLVPPYKRKTYVELDYTFDKNFFKARPPLYLKGHRQSEKYFKLFHNEIRTEYQLKNELISNVSQLASQLSSDDTLSIHIRRGDYLRLPIILDWHGVLSLEYYSLAIETVLKKVPSIKIFYFSDDIEWIEKELLPIYPGTIVSGVVSHNHYEDFYLMSQCRHNIIANSSFSWWAAWLNPNPDKIVITPKKWFNKPSLNSNDLMPEEWIRV